MKDTLYYILFYALSKLTFIYVLRIYLLWMLAAVLLTAKCAPALTTPFSCNMFWYEHNYYILWVDRNNSHPFLLKLNLGWWETHTVCLTPQCSGPWHYCYLYINLSTLETFCPSDADSEHKQQRTLTACWPWGRPPPPNTLTRTRAHAFI